MASGRLTGSAPCGMTVRCRGLPSERVDAVGGCTLVPPRSREAHRDRAGDLVTVFHIVPFQCRITLPTAQALLADLAATPSRDSSGPGLLGLGTCFHARPFQ